MKHPAEYPTFSRDQLGFFQSYDNLRAAVLLSQNVAKFVCDRQESLQRLSYAKPSLPLMWNSAVKFKKDAGEKLGGNLYPTPMCENASKV